MEDDSLTATIMLCNADNLLRKKSPGLLVKVESTLVATGQEREGCSMHVKSHYGNCVLGANCIESFIRERMSLSNK